MSGQSEPGGGDVRHECWGSHVADNPGRHLQDFYAVVLGVALVLAVEQVVDAAEAGSPVDWHSVPLFVAFAALAFSYYHGSARYLDVMYSVEGPKLSKLRIASDLIQWDAPCEPQVTRATLGK